MREAYGCPAYCWREFPGPGARRKDAGRAGDTVRRVELRRRTKEVRM